MKKSKFVLVVSLILAFLSVSCIFTSALTSADVKNVEVLNVTAVSKNSVSLSWDKVNGATHYGIYRYDETEKHNIILGYTDKTSYVVNGLTENAEYRLSIRPFAIIANGVNVYSPKYAIVTVKPCTAPRNVKELQAQIEDDTVLLQWNSMMMLITTEYTNIIPS